MNKVAWVREFEPALISPEHLFFRFGIPTSYYEDAQIALQLAKEYGYLAILWKNQPPSTSGSSRSILFTLTVPVPRH